MAILLLFPLSGLVRAAALYLPFRLSARLLGSRHGNIQVSSMATPAQVRLASRIGSRCDLAGRHTPWESKCPVKAVMAGILLRRYGIPYVIHLGVAGPASPGKSPGLTAHARVAVGPRIIAGRAGHRDFRAVSTFLSPVLLRPAARPRTGTGSVQGTRAKQ